jgi:ATP synthase protein I
LIVRSFYTGAAGKMLLTAGMFTLVFVNLKPLNAPAVFIGFAIVQMLNWVVPLIVGKQDAQKL